jgi:PIN domain nuclease of toxin-antitoxin system
MNYLLDTHVFLWMLSAPDKLSEAAVKVIEDPRHMVFVSAVSAVEISIKSALGKLDAPSGLEGEIGSRGLQELPLTYRHGERLADLPGHHQDPFDRMLIAQALTEKLILITRDEKMRLYTDLKLIQA